MNAAAVDPLALPMVSGLGAKATDNDGRNPEALRLITFHDVRALVDNPQQIEKPRSQWLIPSTHQSRKNHDKNGKRPVIWADLDNPTTTIEQTADIVRGIVGGCDFEVYASSSATADKQKCRILVPVKRGMPPEQWIRVSEVFLAKLKAAGIEGDPASKVLGQVLYLPNRGKFYDTASARNGDLFEPLDVWGRELEQRAAELQRQAEEQKQAQEAARTRREALNASRSTSAFERPIDAFNVAYDVAEILTRNGYAQRGDTFRHPASATGNYSARVRIAAGGDRRVHSLSTSDPLYTGGKGGDGAHDAFSAFCVLEHGGNRDAATKDAGDNWLTIGGESWNKVRHREWAQQQKQQHVERVFAESDLDPETGEIVTADGMKPDPLEWHPLAQIVEHATETPAVRWLIPGLIENGVVTISGARGVGKTTSILPLAMTAAGLHHPDSPLKPKHWRHVVYIVEHVDQAHRIVDGIVKYGELGITMEDVRERLHLVEAKRLPPAQVVKVGKLYRERYAREVNGVELKPLVVFDTKAAVLELENENDNSEGSRAVAAIRQDFEGLPAWIIGHIAKASFGKTDVEGLSDRGAGSFEADTIQNCYLVKENGQRLFLVGKERCSPKWRELKVETGVVEVLGVDEFGDLEPTTLTWGILAPLEVPRAQAREQARQEANEAAELVRRAEMRQAVFDAVEVAWRSGNPLSKNGVKGTVRGFQSKDVLLELEALLAEGWLHEIGVPSAERVHPRKAFFLVKLESREWDVFRDSGTLPADKLVIPQSWRKPEISIVPEVEPENPEN
jgi:hypothetical protein